MDATERNIRTLHAGLVKLREQQSETDKAIQILQRGNANNTEAIRDLQQQVAVLKAMQKGRGSTSGD